MTRQEISDDAPANKPLHSEEEPAQLEGELASKLFRELSDWRRQRDATDRRTGDSNTKVKGHAPPARTIKVRGHETLVIRKPRLGSKPRRQEN
jgi:hypothetical protein